MINKKNSIFAVLLIAILFSFSTSFSQQEKKVNKTPEEKAAKITGKMKEKLSLSDDQYKEMYNLMLQKLQTRSENKEKYKSMDKETRQKMKSENREAMNKQIEGILNQDQLSKYREMKSKHKDGKHNKRKYKNGKHSKHNSGNNIPTKP